MNRAEAPPDSTDLRPWPPAKLSDVGLFRLIARHTGRHFESSISWASMGDALPDGSLIRITHHEARDWRVGQVVAFLAGSRIMVHRIAYVGRWGRARDFLITQGDGNWACDPPIALETVAGRVAEIRSGDEWRTVESRKPPLLRRIVSYPSRAVLCVLLECNPALAVGVVWRMRRLHMLLRRVVSKLRFVRAGDVRD